MMRPFKGSNPYPNAFNFANNPSVLAGAMQGNNQTIPFLQGNAPPSSAGSKIFPPSEANSNLLELSQPPVLGPPSAMPSPPSIPFGQPSHDILTELRDSAPYAGEEEPYNMKDDLFDFFIQMIVNSSQPGATAAGAAGQAASDTFSKNKKIHKKRQMDNKEKRHALDIQLAQLGRDLRSDDRSALNDSVGRRLDEARIKEIEAELNGAGAGGTEFSGADAKNMNILSNLAKKVKNGGSLTAAEESTARAINEMLAVREESIETDANGVSTTRLNSIWNPRKSITETYGEDIAAQMFGQNANPAPNQLPTVTEDEEIELLNQPGALQGALSWDPNNGLLIDQKVSPKAKEAIVAKANAQAALEDMNIIRDLVWPINEETGQREYNRDLALKANLAGGTYWDEDTQKAQRAVDRVKEILLRLRSGAAVPESEVERYEKLYGLNPFDKPETSRTKINTLYNLFNNMGLQFQGKPSQANVDWIGQDNAAPDTPAAPTPAPKSKRQIIYDAEKGQYFVVEE